MVNPFWYVKTLSQRLLQQNTCETMAPLKSQGLMMVHQIIQTAIAHAGSFNYSTSAAALLRATLWAVSAGSSLPEEGHWQIQVANICSAWWLIIANSWLSWWKLIVSYFIFGESCLRTHVLPSSYLGCLVDIVWSNHQPDETTTVQRSSVLMVVDDHKVSPKTWGTKLFSSWASSTPIWSCRTA